MTIVIAINGAGRIGRALLRVAVERGDPAVVALNDLATLEQIAHLLRHDSTLGSFPESVEVADDGLVIGGRSVAYSRSPTPSEIDWGAAEPRMVVETTGRFTDREQAARHLTGGVRRVVISANSRDADALVCYGVNHDTIDAGAKVISAASCTTNCAAATLAPLVRTVGVEWVELLTVHCYTSSQSLVDAARPDLRRSRNAGLNLIPTTTGASWALENVFPGLEGKVRGYSVRAPVAQVSLVDLVVKTGKSLIESDLVDVLTEAAGSDLAGILQVSTEPLVSTDFIGNPHSAIVDREFLQVDGRRLRILAWYDNEVGYVNRLADLVLFLSEHE